MGGRVCAAFDTVLKTQQHQTFVLPDGNVTMRSRRLLVTDSDAAADATDAQRGTPGGAGGGAGWGLKPLQVSQPIHQPTAGHCGGCARGSRCALTRFTLLTVADFNAAARRREPRDVKHANATTASRPIRRRHGAD